MSKMIGIYKITNIVNKKAYIGSSIDINVRWQQHVNDLNNNKHINKRLQNAWNRYGQSNFLFEILQVLETEDKLLLIEQDYLDEYKSYNRNIGYNIAKYASAPMRGRKHTRAAIQKQIANQSGPKNWQFGKKRTKKHSRALGLALGGLTEEKENNLILDYKSSIYSLNDLIHKYNISEKNC